MENAKGANEGKKRKERFQKFWKKSLQFVVVEVLPKSLLLNVKNNK